MPSFFLLHYKNFMSKLKLNDFEKAENKNNSLTVQITITISPLRGKVGRISERKRVHCWSICISRLCQAVRLESLPIFEDFLLLPYFVEDFSAGLLKQLVTVQLPK